jgi:uncharacterized protein (DUF1330 family)
MNRKHILALAVIAGIEIGVAGATMIHAQEAKVAPAYMIAEVDVTDPTTFQKYAQSVPATFVPFNGQYLVRAGKTAVLEGEAPKRIVVVAFDSMEKARAWYDSAAYDAIKPIRHSSANTRSFIVEGVASK